jgi:predicted DNA binding protein
VLGTAYEMGYFEYPREANATAVAEELDIGLSALAEHLAAAQGKLLSELLAG